MNKVLDSSILLKGVFKPLKSCQKVYARELETHQMQNASTTAR